MFHHHWKSGLMYFQNRLFTMFHPNRDHHYSFSGPFSSINTLLFQTWTAKTVIILIIRSGLLCHICRNLTWLMHKSAVSSKAISKQQAEKVSFLTHRTSGCCRESGRPPEEPAAGGTAAHSLRWSHPSSRYRCGGHSNRSHPSWGSTLGDTVSRTSTWYKWGLSLIAHLITLWISSPLNVEDMLHPGGAGKQSRCGNSTNSCFH